MGCTDSASAGFAERPSQIFPFPNPSPNKANFQSIHSSETSNYKTTKSQIQKFSYTIFKKKDLSQLYAKVNGDTEMFFSLLSELISAYYLRINTYVIEEMNASRFNKNQGKIFISEKIMIMSLEVLRFIGEQTNFNFDLNVLREINIAQRNMLDYFQTKYPRGGKAFVPGQLMDIFKPFNMVSHPDNDILKNANISFIDPSQEKIIRTIKTLFNTILDEIDSQFPIFQKILQEKVFDLRDADGKKKFLQYKIGRKIPEAIAKYKIGDEEESQDLKITSPEIFRVIIKWIDYLEERVSSLDSQESPNSIKAVNLEDGTIQYFDQEKLQSILNSLKAFVLEEVEKGNDLKSHSKNKVRQLRKDMNIFNMNLLKILEYSERKQKYVPKDDSVLIRYANSNTLLVSWMLVQRLIYIIKYLIEISLKVSKEEGYQVDLVDFQLTDLMRGMVKGTKKEVLQIFQNIKRLESEGLIKIIKIKNRLETSLNDVMIIFKMQSSYLICELQLVLSEGEKKTERLKNVEFLNHFLYELKRTPYGVLSQTAVVLGFKDSKISFDPQLEFQKIEQLNISECQRNHPNNVHYEKVQHKPILCSYCAKFYNSYENVFPYHYCDKCHIFKCCTCIMNYNQAAIQNQIDKKFHEKLTSILLSDKQRIRQFDLKEVLKHFYPQKIYLQKNNIMNPKDLYKFFETKKHRSMFPDQYQNSFILLGQFIGQHLKINLLYWQETRSQLQYAYFPKNNFLKQRSLIESQYDFFVLIQKKQIKQVPYEEIQKYHKLYFSNTDLNSLKGKVKMCSLIQMDKNVLILRNEQDLVTQIDGVKIDEYMLAGKKQMKYKSLDNYWDNLPQIKLAHENIQMKNFGLTKTDLDFFQKFAWKDSIKILNISNNKITDINVIFTNLINLNELFVAKNFIQKVNINKQHSNLQKLVCYENQIKEFIGLQKLINVSILNLSNNQLKMLSVVTLKSLKQLSMNNNQFISGSFFIDSEFPELEQLSLKSFTSYDSVIKTIKIRSNKLKKFFFESNQGIETLEVQSDGIENLYVSSNLNYLKFKSNNLKYLSISNNLIRNMFEILEKDFPSATNILMNSAFDTEQLILPIIKSPKLLELNLDYTPITDIASLNVSNLNSLKILRTSYVQIEQIPQIDLVNLEEWAIISEKLKKIDKLQKCDLLKLKKFTLGGYSYMQQVGELPKLNFDVLEHLKIENLQMKSLKGIESSKLMNLKELYFYCIKCQQFPKIKLPVLQKLDLTSCSFQKIKNLQYCSLPQLRNLRIELDCLIVQEPDDKATPKIQTLDFPQLKELTFYMINMIDFSTIFTKLVNLCWLSLQNSPIDNFPILCCPKLTSINISDCNLKDISNLSQCKLPSLQNFSVIYNYEGFKSIPYMNFPKLKELTMSSCQIQNVDELTTSKFDDLQTLNLDNNAIKIFPALAFKKLKNINFTYNKFQEITRLEQCKLPQLKIFDLSDCTTLENKVLPVINFPSLTTLRLYNCNLVNIDSLSKSQLPNLQIIEFSSCLIAKIPSITAPQLSQLIISCNFIPQTYNEQEQKATEMNIEGLETSSLPSLTNLSISHCKIVGKIPKLKFKNLKSFTLDSVEFLEDIQINQNQLPQLKTFNVYYCKNIKKLPYFRSKLDQYQVYSSELEDITFLKNTESRDIIFQQNKISAVPKLSLGITQKLNLNNNLLKDINSLVFNDIQDLSLNYNEITQFPVTKMLKLTGLHLTSNKLEKINLQNQNFPVLNFVELSMNNFHSDQDIVINLPKLENIYFDNNKLKKISFFKKNKQVKNVSYMSFDNNQISQIMYLPASSSLSLGYNKLKNLDFLSNYQSINEIYLTIDGNQLQDVSGIKYVSNKMSSISINQNECEFGFDGNQINLSRIDQIYLSNSKLNKFENINNKNAPKLQYIYLDSNSLKQFGKGTFLPQLTYLELSNNNITKIYPFADTLKKLSTIYLYQNQLQNLDWLTKMQLPKLETLDLHQNKIKKMIDFSKFKKLSFLNIANNPLEDIDALCPTQPKEINSFEFSVELCRQQLKESFKQRIKKLYPNSIDSTPEDNDGENIPQGNQ